MLRVSFDVPFMTLSLITFWHLLRCDETLECTKPNFSQWSFEMGERAVVLRRRHLRLLHAPTRVLSTFLAWSDVKILHLTAERRRQRRPAQQAAHPYTTCVSFYCVRSASWVSLAVFFVWVDLKLSEHKLWNIRIIPRFISDHLRVSLLSSPTVTYDFSISLPLSLFLSLFLCLSDGYEWIHSWVFQEWLHITLQRCSELREIRPYEGHLVLTGSEWSVQQWVNSVHSRGVQEGDGSQKGRPSW